MGVALLVGMKTKEISIRRLRTDELTDEDWVEVQSIQDWIWDVSHYRTDWRLTKLSIYIYQRRVQNVALRRREVV
jgi:hypothetical protein